jgi:hypothetical protein
MVFYGLSRIEALVKLNYHLKKQNWQAHSIERNDRNQRQFVTPGSSTSSTLTVPSEKSLVLALKHRKTRLGICR